MAIESGQPCEDCELRGTLTGDACNFVVVPTNNEGLAVGLLSDGHGGFSEVFELSTDRMKKIERDMSEMSRGFSKCARRALLSMGIQPGNSCPIGTPNSDPQMADELQEIITRRERQAREHSINN